MSTPSTSRFRSALARMVAPQHQVHAEEEHERAAGMGGMPIADLTNRSRATICGTLRSVTLRPRAGTPALEALLYDGTGVVRVIWLGRRQIVGIEPGRRIRIEGMVSDCDGEPSVFNPRYELIARD